MSSTARWKSIVCLALLAAVPACGRQYYRRQADREVDQIVAEKNDDPRWMQPYFTIEQDPRSRFFDPYDPDKPPLPPDDPTSHELMHYVDGKKGWSHWHDNGDRDELESPCWREQLAAYLPMNDEGEVRLSLETALRLAYIHSPDYQQQLETLYLTALDVSTERFRLDSQFFGGTTSNYTRAGPQSRLGNLSRTSVDTTGVMRRQSEWAGDPANDPRILARVATPGGGVSRSLIAGGELLAGFANSMVWQFTGKDTHTNVSIVGFNLVQPLLRQAGKDVALERLTRSERLMLSNLRQFAQYRQGFYTLVAIGDLGVGTPTRQGGLLGGTGLTGFTGQGAGGQGGVGDATNQVNTGGGQQGGGGGAAAAGFAGGGEGTVGGYFGLLQRRQLIRNREDFLVGQEQELSKLAEFLAAGLIDRAQYDQFDQSVVTERANLRRDIVDFENQVDNFVRTLGLPPGFDIELDEGLLRRFRFVSEELAAVRVALLELQAQTGELAADPDLASVQQVLSAAASLAANASKGLTVLDEDVRQMRAAANRRAEQMEPARRRAYEEDLRQILEKPAALRDQLTALTDQLSQLRANLQDANRAMTRDTFVAWLRGLRELILDAELTQTRARLEAIEVEPVELNSDDAFTIARIQRLDLMNNRASLVDTWRLIAFNADALQSTLNFTVSGDISTVGDNPVKFRSPTGTFNVGVEVDGPFARLQERNNYRQSLIDYQRNRRAFIRREDDIHRQLRQYLRQLRRLQANLELQRQAMVIAIRRVDLEREKLNKPAPPAAAGIEAQKFGPTLVRDLLSALSDLRTTKDNFTGAWFNFQATRMQLTRDVGSMLLDDEGNWIETPLPRSCEVRLEELPDTPPVPDVWFEQLPPQPSDN